MSDSSAEFIALQRALAGRYSLEREIGRGGMGIVFLARDVALTRPVAIKLLPPAFAEEAVMRERFLREARTAASLFHPNIVPIHLVEENGDLVFFVMAYVEGESVGERVRRAGPMTADAVRRMLQEVAWALGYAHEKGVVHRDVKPDNILLERFGGRALVTDFGIARVAETSSGTGRGELLGTVQYMSPEQATGERVDGRSDLYSLGVTAFFALTGRLPFEANNAAGFIHHHVSVPAPRVATRTHALPPSLAEAVDRCLAKDPAQRFATGQALADAIADAGAARQDVPPEVRTLLRRIRTASAAYGLITAVTFCVAMPWLAKPFTAALGQVAIPGLVVLIVVPAFLVGRVAWRLVRDAQRVIRNGYGMVFVHEALSAEARAMIEEGAVEAHAKVQKALAPSREKGLAPRDNPVLKAGRAREGAISNASKLLAVGAVMSLAQLGSILSGAPLQSHFSVAGYAVLLTVGSLFAFAAGPAVGQDSPLVALDWGERLLIGRFGRLLFRVAYRGVKDRAPDVPTAGERTEVALKSAIEDLYGELPREVRFRFKDVREVIGRLERDAAAMRDRDVKLSDALARVDMHAPATSRADQERLKHDLESARGAIRGRLATAVAAIESVRLDLLRLSAGVGSADDLTADLERARAIGVAVDAEFAARREVENIIEHPSPTPR